MRISSTMTQAVQAFSYQANTQARAFGRKVEQAEAKSRFKVLRPVLWACKRMSDWIISHTHNVSPALTATKFSHPVDKVLWKSPVTLTRKLSRQLVKNLSHPGRGLTFNEANISSLFLKDVFRQNLHLHVQNDAGSKQKTFDSFRHYQKHIESESGDALLEQAQEALSDFADNHPPVVRTLSSIANQGAQIDQLHTLEDMINRKMGEQGMISFGDNSFTNCDITRRPDGLFQVEQNYDMQTAYYHNHDGNSYPLKGAAAHIKVAYLVNADGKVVKVKPEFHVKWPGFGNALSASDQ